MPKKTHSAKKVESEKSPESRYDIPFRFSMIEEDAPLISSSTSSHIQLLQRTIGNRAVGRIIQAKLNIGQSNDKYEQEADRVPHAVIKMPEPQVQRQTEEAIPAKLINSDVAKVQRQEETEEKEELVRAKRKSGLISDIAPATTISSSGLQGSSGQPLSESARKYFERRFGYDLNSVRILTDTPANNSAKYLNARAYTIGNDVVFGKGQYAPESATGKELLAHELTHVIQQRSGNSMAFFRSNPSIREQNPISRTDSTMIARWKISGNSAIVDSKSDRLWNLAKSITGHGSDWPCIWIKNMKSPKSWEDNYERYIQLGDEFDVSNLKLKTGPAATFTYHGRDDGLQALTTLYGGANPVDLELDIGNLANNGETPIKNLTIAGHSGGDSVWGDTGNFSATLNSEEPAPSGIGAHSKQGPHRCWFTRNATVRIVGCSSETVARPFAGSFLRRGASALGANRWLCGWHQTSPVSSRFVSAEGPPCTWPPTATWLTTAAALNGAPGLWIAIKGRL